MLFPVSLTDQKSVQNKDTSQSYCVLFGIVVTLQSCLFLSVYNFCSVSVTGKGCIHFYLVRRNNHVWLFFKVIIK